MHLHIVASLGFLITLKTHYVQNDLCLMRLRICDSLLNCCVCKTGFFARLINFHGRHSLQNCMFFFFLKLRTFRNFITKLYRQQAEIMSMNIFCTLDNAKLKIENIRGFLNTVHTCPVQLIQVYPQRIVLIPEYKCTPTCFGYYL